MQRLTLICSLFLAIAGYAPHAASHEEEHGGMAMPMNTLLAAQLTPDQVVGGAGGNTGSGTGAFFIDPVHRTLEYRLTYEGLKNGVKSIALYNFGAGGRGEVIALLCGEDHPCAPGTIAGRVVPDAAHPFDNNLIGEFDSERVYVEIVDAAGQAVLRGQLAPHSAMVPSATFVAELSTPGSKGQRATGTAIFTETYMPGGKVAVTYLMTVAGLSGPATGAVLAASPSPGDERVNLPHGKDKADTQYESAKRISPAQCGSLDGVVEVDAEGPAAPLISRLRDAGHDQAGIAVMTANSPRGEVFGVLKPIK
jgi:hypothetical protein